MREIEDCGEYLVQGIIDGISYWEKAALAVQKMVAAIGEFAAAVVAACVDCLPTVLEAMRYQSAYSLAEKDHPQWVRFAKYHKKKRIRKKYHDRIMREYGGSNDA